jgi:phage repressor protein C with HTH and peptisase S24 domain
MIAFNRKTTRRERQGNLGKTAFSSAGVTTETVDVAAIRVQGDDMAPVYCDGDVVLYRRPGEDLAVRPGDDVLVLLPGPGGSLQLLLRRLDRWDDSALKLRALDLRRPPIHEHPRTAVLCGKVIGRLARPAPGQGEQRWR